MGARNYELLVPTIIETQLTGRYGAVKQEHRARQFVVEFWREGTRCTKNGESIAWEKLPAAIRKVAHEGFAIIKQGHEMRREESA